MKRQRIIGALLVIISILLVLMASRGTTIEERDATAVLFILPLGLYMIFTKTDCMYKSLREPIVRISRPQARARYYPPESPNCRYVIIPHFPSVEK